MKQNMKTEQNIEIASPATPLEKLDRSLSDVFNTSPIEVEAKEVLPTSVIVDDSIEDSTAESIKTDHNFARSNMYSLVQQGSEALQYAIELAKSTESPRAFEVVATMMKSLADMNGQLIDLHDKTNKVLKPSIAKQEPQKTVNNTVVFNGTTAEINKLLNDMKKEQ